MFVPPKILVTCDVKKKNTRKELSASPGFEMKAKKDLSIVFVICFI